MHKILILTILIFIGTEAMAELAPVATSIPPLGCPSTITQVRVYRCICRANLVSVSGTSNVSNPITLSNGLTYIYSASTLQGAACTGIIAANVCNPVALNGMVITGAYSCALGNTTETDFEIR